jgi:putative oxidoreductase
MRSEIQQIEAAMGTHSTAVSILSWILRITAAAILLQTLFFKFTGAPESIYIFTKVHAEPWGRIGSGVIELIASVLMLTPRYTWIGSFLAFCTGAGAILSHLTLLGIEVQGDKGLLFALAITVLVASGINLYLHRTEIPLVGRGWA